jgi:hypothetical protein
MNNEELVMPCFTVFDYNLFFKEQIRSRGLIKTSSRAAQGYFHQSTSGGASRDRTDDLLLAKQALSQLSYGPARGARHPVRE